MLGKGLGLAVSKGRAAAFGWAHPPAATTKSHLAPLSGTGPQPAPTHFAFVEVKKKGRTGGDLRFSLIHTEAAKGARA